MVVPVYRTLPSDLYTPASAYLNLLGERTGFSSSPSFLLESVVGGEKVGRYSYIGIAPKDGIVLKDGVISELRRDNKVPTQRIESTDPLRAIQDSVSKVIAKTPGLPPFVGGYVGYIGYEVVSSFEDTVPTSNPDVLGVPDAMLFNYDNVVVFDHVRNELKVTGNIHVENPDDLEEQYTEVTSRIDQIVDRIQSPLPAKSPKRIGREVKKGVTESNFSKEDYLKAIEKAKEYVCAGDIIQVVLSQRFARKTEADPFSLYRALRRVNPSPFMIYFDYGDFQIIGASPELLLKVEDGIVTTCPIAGTRPRGQTPEEDEKLAEELKNNEKEKAEHRMLLDLGRNDVGKIAASGTVSVTRIMEVERFSHVMHLASEVQGKLRDQYTSLDALRSAFPAGTLSGAPKIRAMQIIDELENEKRGPYGGVMGYISYDGNLEMAITIRTMVFKDGTAYAQAGGGIVYDSDPEAEFEETIIKSKGSLKAIDLAEKEYL
ncbi:MAG: anthranilate synthase component I [Candidatus Daviesbacteria bacterium]|nr:anthranilate synthase component I [Candidatus Daviesbacteria bacterium]